MDFLKFAIAGKILVVTACHIYVLYVFPRLLYIKWTSYLGSKFVSLILDPDSGTGAWISINLP